MARASTHQRWRNPAPEGDDVQRSIELLDKVLSEYDEQGAGGEIEEIVGEENSTASGINEGDLDVDADVDGEPNPDSSTEPSIGLTPDDDSPVCSFEHQSEDDGYMSMNGRKAKMALVALRPVPDCPEPVEPTNISNEFPPPPEEAQRIISTLLPIVSPSNSSKRKTNPKARRADKQSEESTRSRRGHTTQTTLPKTRRRKLYGLWDRCSNENRRNCASGKFASLPHDVQVSNNWIVEVKSQDKSRENQSRRRRIRSSNIDNDLTDTNAILIVKSTALDDKLDSEPLKPDKIHLDQDQVYEDEIDDEEDDVDDDDDDDDEDDDDDDDEEEDHQLDENERFNLSDSSCDGRFARRRRRKRKSGLARGISESESERCSIPRSSSVSVERFSMRANCDSSDFSRANSTSNERFHSDFSLAVASASSNDRVSNPTSDPFSLRNLDFAASAFSLGRADSCSERFSDVYSTRNSDFSTRNSTDFRTQSEEEERFSDDSLEEMLNCTVPEVPPIPPPEPEPEPVVSKRHSIAWEVSLEQDPLYAPGSTKVVGRRRRRSSDVSSVGSASKLRDLDYDWQESQRRSTTDDDLISPYSSTNELDQMRRDYPKNGTYVIRGRSKRRERKSLLNSDGKKEGEELTGVTKRYSNTFDDIKSLLREGRLEGLNEPPPNFIPPVPPDLVRVLSLPQFDEVDSSSLEKQSLEGKETNLPSCHNDYQEYSSSDCSPPPPAPEKITNLKCNGINNRAQLPTSKSLDIKNTRLDADKIISSNKKNRKTDVKNDQIPVNVLIEDQIVKKALNENRRQLEKVSDAIKELESFRNSESTSLVDNKQKLKNKNDKIECNNTTDLLIKDNVNCESDYDIRKRTTNTDIGYSSNSRRIPQNDIDNLSKNDQTQIENVIDAILEDSKKNPDFQVSVEVLEFPPLPPSPVEEADEESTDGGGGNTNPTLGISISSSSSGHYGSHRNTTRQTSRIEYRPRVPPHRMPTSDVKEHRCSLDNSRSMDTGYSRGRRTPTTITNSRRDVPVERRTLPTDLPGPSRRRTSTRQSPSSDNPSGTPVIGNNNIQGGNTGMQTSCSLPETPVFARGNDIPRTPQHTSGNTLSTTTSITSTSGTQPRRQPGWYAPTTATTGGYRRNNPGLEQAIIGTELLRLAGGPNRGWYPTRRGTNQPRPASIEHLERLNNAYECRVGNCGEQRKPLTLPTNITPNKYFGQSKHSSSGTREALRRVTSLLIKKGGGTKDNNKTKEFSGGPYAGGEPNDAPKKKGFFKNFWKRSRHYSLENQ